MKNSYYSMLNKLIRQMKTDGKFIIKKSELTNLLDFSEENREDLETMCANAMASVAFYQNNYRATQKGRGIFVDTDAIKNKQTMQMLIKNSELDVESRLAVAQKLTKMAQNLPDADVTQMAFTNMDDDGNIMFYEEMTDAEFIEMLEELQDNVKKVVE